VPDPFPRRAPPEAAVDLDLPDHHPTQGADATEDTTHVRVEDDRREDDTTPDARRAARNEDPVRSGAKCRET